MMNFQAGNGAMSAVHPAHPFRGCRRSEGCARKEVAVVGLPCSVTPSPEAYMNIPGTYPSRPGQWYHYGYQQNEIRQPQSPGHFNPWPGTGNFPNLYETRWRAAQNYGRKQGRQSGRRIVRPCQQQRRSRAQDCHTQPDCQASPRALILAKRCRLPGRCSACRRSSSVCRRGGNS